MNSNPPCSSIVIVTRNRAAVLQTALDSCLAQTYRPLEILVFDDASEDDTADMVARDFPSVRLLRGVRREGLIARRSEGFRIAKGRYVFSLDDDAYYTDVGTIAQVVGQLEAAPHAGAIAMTYIEKDSRKKEIFEVRAEQPGEPVRSFRGCAHAIRREAAMQLGGYRDFFVHQGEERDFCLRMLDSKLDVIQGENAPVVHLPSPVRDQERMDYYGVRNQLLFDALNIPHPWMPPRLVGDSLRLYVYKLHWHTTIRRAAYVIGGWGACLRFISKRRPVSRTTYQTYLQRPLQAQRPWRRPLPSPVGNCHSDRNA